MGTRGQVNNPKGVNQWTYGEAQKAASAQASSGGGGETGGIALAAPAQMFPNVDFVYTRGDNPKRLTGEDKREYDRREAVRAAARVARQASRSPAEVLEDATMAANHAADRRAERAEQKAERDYKGPF